MIHEPIKCLRVGMYVTVSDDWNDSGGYPKKGQRLRIVEINRIGNDSIWLTVSSDEKNASQRWPIYGYWIFWKDRIKQCPS